MDSREMLRQFRAANWASQADLEAFLGQVGRPPASDIAKLLDLLCEKGLAADPHSHSNRCAAFSYLAAQVADRELFIPYVNALKRGDSTVRATIAPQLARVNNVAGHAELASLMNSPDAALRQIVGGLLKQIGGRAVFEGLVQVVRSGAGPGLAEAMDLLVAIAGHFSVSVLAAVLVQPQFKERVLAARLLGDRERFARDLAGAERALVSVLGDSDDRVQAEAIAALAQLCKEEVFFGHVQPLLTNARPAVAVAMIRASATYRSQRVYSLLSEKFLEGPRTVRLAVLDACESIANEEVVPVLVEALGHRQLTIRQRASTILAQFARAGVADLARTILWLLRSRDVNVRRLAVDMARHVRDRGAQLWPKLMRYLRDEDWWVRERVTDALLEMAGQELTQHLIGLVQDSSPIVRRYAIDVFTRLKDTSIVGLLVRIAQNDEDWWVREQAIRGLGELGGEEVLPCLLSLMDEEPALTWAILDALKALRATEAAPRVAQLLVQPEPDLKLAVIQCLQVIGDARFASTVQPCLESTDPNLRQAARDLLTLWNFQPAAVELQGGERGLSLLDRILVALTKREGDDLIISAERKPYIRRMGHTAPLANNVFSPAQVEGLIWPLLTPAQRQDLEVLQDVDFSYELATLGTRFRVNVFRQHTGLAAVFRRIGSQLLGLDVLGVPAMMRKLGDLKNGLVLVGGPTGSGKSTTLAALIDYINHTFAHHIVTLEDPIEAIHQRKQSLVNQREIGTHTPSFHAALRGALRQDPDVLLVGEMRDLETIRFAVTAAETGHLVFGTIHTVSADTSIDRMINAFPPDEQNQVRSQLADTLRAVVCQYLLRKKDGGRALACEIMLNTDAVANLIRKGKTFQIPAIVATSREEGMQSMDWDLERMVREGIISAEQAYAKARDKHMFEEAMGGTPGKVEAPSEKTSATMPKRGAAVH